MYVAAVGCMQFQAIVLHLSSFITLPLTHLQYVSSTQFVNAILGAFTVHQQNQTVESKET